MKLLLASHWDVAHEKLFEVLLEPTSGQSFLKCPLLVAIEARELFLGLWSRLVPWFLTPTVYGLVVVMGLSPPLALHRDMTAAFLLFLPHTSCVRKISFTKSRSQFLERLCRLEALLHIEEH